MTPLLILGAGFTLVICHGMSSARPSVRVSRALGVLTLAAAAFSALCMQGRVWPLLHADGLATGWQLLVLLGALPMLLLMPEPDDASTALLLAGAAGLTLLCSTRHLIALFVGLELASLPAYALVFGLSRSRQSLEAAIKYFFAGACAGAMFLFGAAIFYAVTGGLELQSAIWLAPPRHAGLALALLGAAALFKLGAVPLHFWLPDAYGAAAPELAGFMSTSIKAAALLLLMRIAPVFPQKLDFWLNALPVLAAATMILGNLMALRQKTLTRMLAHSSIAHAGYLLIGVDAWLRRGAAPGDAAALWVYLLGYLFSNTLAFAALRLSGARTLADARGLCRRQPFVAAMLAIALLSLSGLPPTAGFLGKLAVFWDAFAAGTRWLVLLALANSLIGIAYYFRAIGALYFDVPEPWPAVNEPPRLGARALLWACALPAALLGLLPGVMNLARELLGGGR